MTVKGAIEDIEQNVLPSVGGISLIMAIDALEKQIPKKPIMYDYFHDEDMEDYLCCPTCKDILTDRIPAKNKDFYFHCMNCGQKFDWSDEE